MFPLDFQSQVFRRLVSPVQDLGVWVPNVEVGSLASQEKDSYLAVLPHCGSQQLGCGFFLGKPISLTCLPILMLSFYSFLWRLCPSSFQLPFQGNYFIYSFRHVMSWEEVNLLSSYAATLTPL